MTARLLQPSFTAGEVAPALYARVDTGRIAVGLRRCREFIVRPYGGVENRCGTRFLGVSFDAAHPFFRLLPFVFSADPGSDVAYVLELGHQYCRFIANDSFVQVQLTDVSDYAGGTTYPMHAFVKVGAVIYRSLQAGNTGHAPAGSPTWWVADATLVVATPWTETQLPDVRYTQSADVMYFAHNDVAPRTLSRTSSSFFVVALHVTQEGPFRDLNTDESRVVVSNKATGDVTLTSNADIFSANSVGALFYMETKNLGQIKPWVVGDRSVALGDLRRNDGKTYKAVTIPAGGTSYHETGNRAPVHDFGRAWDGGGDVRTDGTNTWTNGIEWEYVDSGYGVVEITAFTDAQHVNGTVRKRLPAQVVGTVPAASNTWAFASVAGTLTYALAGATDGNYTVTIDGVPVQSDPNYVPPPVGGGGGLGSGLGGNTDRRFESIP